MVDCSHEYLIRLEKHNLLMLEALKKIAEYKSRFWSSAESSEAQFLVSIAQAAIDAAEGKE